MHDQCTAENLRGLDTNLNKVQTILVKITIMLILIFLSNSFFNSFMKMKNEKRTVFRFPFFYENEKRMRVLKIQSKTLLNKKMVAKYLNFVFHIEVKTKSNYKILNFVFQFLKNMKWHFGYTDCLILNPLAHKSIIIFGSNKCRHLRCSVKKVVLKNFAIFTGKHLCWSLFLIKFIK